MVMTGLAWNLKAWWALWLPEDGRWGEAHRAQKQEVLRMEFKTFLNAFIKIPCQIVRTGRQLIYRVLNYNPRLPVFFRLCRTSALLTEPTDEAGVWMLRSAATLNRTEVQTSRE